VENGTATFWSAASGWPSDGIGHRLLQAFVQLDRTSAVWRFTVDVDDCGEPGSSTAGGTDMFKIQTFDYMAGGPLIGGNIQIRAGRQ